MHQNAEYGIAAHWRYKEKGKQDDTYEQRINWLRTMMEWEQDVEDAEEFVDSMKTDVFQDRVYVFTPKGDIYDLPAGSTAIDFAYHIHTEIGHRCRGAKVDSKLVSLDYKLKTGDQVQILTAKHGGPSRDWLNPNLGLVATQRARAKIRHWFKRQDREQNLTQGKLILDRELHRLSMTALDREELAKQFDFRTVDDLYVAIGCGDLSMSRIISTLSEVEEEKDPLLLPQQPAAEIIDDGKAVTVLGLKGLLSTFARCCKPAPGDEIVGYITRGRGATIHRQDCPNILRVKERERIVKVSWGEAHKTYPVSIEIKAYDRQGLMGDISAVLNEENINIANVDMKINHNLAAIFLTLEIGDIAQLARVLTRIESLPNIMEAHRLRPG
jgi:GTP pyrophosphokinase